MSEVGKGELLFDENQIGKSKSFTLVSHLAKRAIQWSIRIISYSITILILAWLIVSNTSGQLMIIIASIIPFAEVFLFFERIKFKMIKIYTNGIEVYASFFQRRKGFSGFIKKDDILSVTVSSEYKGRIRKNSNKPNSVTYGFSINTLYGKSYNSGPKGPERTKTMVAIMQKNFDIFTVDDTRYVDYVIPIIPPPMN
jgi:hypothetical protein